MDKQASEMLGEAVAAGVMLEAKGVIKRAIGSGVLGSLVGGILADIDVKEASLPGDHTGLFYMAVGADKVGFFSMKRGAFKASLDKMLVQYPRSEVKALEIEKGMMPTAHIVFQDGTHYALMCARINQKKLKKVRELLFQ